MVVADIGILDPFDRPDEQVEQVFGVGHGDEPANPRSALCTSTMASVSRSQ